MTKNLYEQFIENYNKNIVTLCKNIHCFEHSVYIYYSFDTETISMSTEEKTTSNVILLYTIDSLVAQHIKFVAKDVVDQAKLWQSWCNSFIKPELSKYIHSTAFKSKFIVHWEVWNDELNYNFKNNKSRKLIENQLRRLL